MENSTEQGYSTKLKDMEGSDLEKILTPEEQRLIEIRYELAVLGRVKEQIDAAYESAKAHKERNDRRICALEEEMVAISQGQLVFK